MTDRRSDDATEKAEELLERFTTARHKEPAAVEWPTGIIGVLHVIRLGIERVTTLTGSIAMALAWIVFFLGLFNVTTRYIARFIQRDIIIGQVFDLQWMTFGALFLLGFNYAVREDVNPRIDFWWTHFSDKTKAWIDVIGHVVFFLPFLWMSLTILWPYSAQALGRKFDGTWLTWRVWEVWERSADAGGLPRGPIKLLMLIGFILFASQIIAQTIKSFMVLIDRPELGDLAEHEAPTRVE
ncbi:MAG: TRAP transporter small permease subunit [Acidimicrobiia bacterium]